MEWQSIRKLYMSMLSFSPNVTLCIMQTAEMNVLLMSGGIISPSCGTTLSRAFTRRWENNWGSYAAHKGTARVARRLKWALFLGAEKTPCWHSFCFCFHRRPLCCHVIGFTHDDKVERSDPAIVQVSSFLIISSWGENPGKSFHLALRNVSQPGH